MNRWVVGVVVMIAFYAGRFSADKPDQLVVKVPAPKIVIVDSAGHQKRVIDMTADNVRDPLGLRPPGW